MAGGYVKLYRRSLESAVFTQGSGALWRLWTYLLLSANWKDRRLDDGTILRPGQLIRGYRGIATHLGWARSKVERWLRRLERMESIKIETRTGTLAQVITISNWPLYQGEVGNDQDTKRDGFGDATGDASGDIKKKERSKEGKKSG